jgi:hypothetical protein
MIDQLFLQFLQQLRTLKDNTMSFIIREHIHSSLVTKRNTSTTILIPSTQLAAVILTHDSSPCLPDPLGDLDVSTEILLLLCSLMQIRLSMSESFKISKLRSSFCLPVHPSHQPLNPNEIQLQLQNQFQPQPQPQLHLQLQLQNQLQVL